MNNSGADFIPRVLMDQIRRRLDPGRVAVLYGPRRVGKTTLIKKFLEDYQGDYRLYYGEDINTQEVFTAQSIPKYRSLLQGVDLLVIDEAQYINNIGVNLKLIVDHLQELEVIASGSSSFDLAKEVGEPLTGRKWTYTLFPIAQMELSNLEDPVETRSLLEERLIYGSYPEVITSESLEMKRDVLKEIVNSYLFKDLLELQALRHKDKIIDLLRLLAFQIGQEVSLNELGSNLGVAKETVKRYLHLLEEAFVIFELSGFSRNLRKEITKMSKYYFYDNGVRNALIDQFNSFKKRNDVGALWENYLVVERLKKQAYQKKHANNYFWRTYDQKEIDWLEERDGRLYGYEMKWGTDRVKAPNSFIEAYDNPSFQVVNKDHYLDFIT